ncbi:MAG TPA: lipid-A-disaccharide synthase [bacterium]|nr:lipid-A-disaccharide synthase [bacterium]HQL63084.1 lipid-A-disaccharide synthase [bacterium]
MRIFLSAGEQSGDLHGAAVAREILRLQPETELLGLGGIRMESAGVRILYPLPRHAIIGFVGVFRHLPEIWNVWSLVRRSWQTERPDVVVLIDYPGFHLRLIKLAHRMGIPVVYYIAPQMWAWAEYRVAVLRECVRKLLVILPFEEGFFQKHKVDCVFVGHPLMDILQRIKPKAFHSGTVENPTIGLLPGSRRGELKHILPTMLEAAQRIRDSYSGASFALPLAETLNESDLQPFSLPPWVEVTRDPAYRRRTQMDFAWTTSGTATLENAILGVPMAVLYRTHWVNAILARRLIRTHHIGLVNLVAGEKICPEFLQERLQAESLASWTLDFFTDENRRRIMHEELLRARELLGSTGASERAAAEILNLQD